MNTGKGTGNGWQALAIWSVRRWRKSGRRRRRDWGAWRPLSRCELVAAWYRGESDPFGLAAVAAAEQTADDLRLVSNCLRAIKTKIKDNGGKVSATMKEEARGAGALAVVAWRNGALACPAVPGARGRRGRGGGRVAGRVG
jgi:hypothetical protein